MMLDVLFDSIFEGVLLFLDLIVLVLRGASLRRALFGCGIVYTLIQGRGPNGRFAMKSSFVGAGSRGDFLKPPMGYLVSERDLAVLFIFWIV